MNEKNVACRIDGFKVNGCEKLLYSVDPRAVHETCHSVFWLTGVRMTRVIGYVQFQSEDQIKKDTLKGHIK